MAVTAKQLRLTKSITFWVLKLVNLSSMSMPALLTIIEIFLNLSSAGKTSLILSFLPYCIRSALTISTETYGYLLWISYFTVFSFDYVRARRIILKPYAANCIANYFPIPELWVGYLRMIQWRVPNFFHHISWWGFASFWKIVSRIHAGW